MKESQRVCSFEDLWIRRTQFPPGALRAALGNGEASLARLSAEVEEQKAGAEGQHTEPAAAEGANQVPSPVTPTEWQGKHLDENMDDALGIDADRLPVQSPIPNEKGRSRSQAPVARGGGEGKASQTSHLKNGERKRWLKCVMLKSLSRRKRSGTLRYCWHRAQTERSKSGQE